MSKVIVSHPGRLEYALAVFRNQCISEGVFRICREKSYFVDKRTKALIKRNHSIRQKNKHRR